MNSKSLLTLTAVSALGGLGLMHLYLGQLEKQAAGGDKVAVLVAVDDIPVGTVLNNDLLAVRQVPAAYVSPRQVGTEDAPQVLGVRVSTGLRANDFLQWTDLSQGQATGRDLSSLVRDGMRALSLKGSALFDGLLRPGDRVDLLFSTQEGASPGTSTLLQNVMVLSVGGTIDPAAKDSTGYRNPTSVTLSVTLEQSQLITQAQLHGQIALVLRNPDDIVIIEQAAVAAAGDVLKTETARAQSRPSLTPASTRPQEIVRAR